MMKKWLGILFVCGVLSALAVTVKCTEDGEQKEFQESERNGCRQNREGGKGTEMRREKQDKSKEMCRNQIKSEADAQYLPESAIRIPTVKEVSDNPYIYRYNHDLGRAKGLLSKECLNDRYLRLQAVYRANLDAYLREVLDIETLDEELRNSRLGFVSHKSGKQNLYERGSTMGLEFIYLRNNLYIEYLDEEQLSLLERRLETGKHPVTDEIKAMVTETFREIIRVRDPWDWEDRSSFLYPGVQGQKPMIPNHALVLGIANDMEYDASGRLAPDAFRKEKYEFLDRIKKEKEREYSRITGVKVYILIE